MKSSYNHQPVTVSDSDSDEGIRPDYSLRDRTREQLIDRVEDLRSKVRNQSVRLRHIDHELFDLQAAKDKVAADLESATEEEVRLGDRLQDFGLHPDQKAKKTSNNQNELDTVKGGRFEVTEEDLDAIRDINITLRIGRYSSKLVGNPQMTKTFFQQVNMIQLSANNLNHTLILLTPSSGRLICSALMSMWSLQSRWYRR